MAQSEQSLDEHGEQLNAALAVLEQLPVRLALLDGQGQVLLANPAWAQAFPQCGPGCGCLDQWEQGSGPEVEPWRQAARKIRQLLSGQQARLQLQLPDPTGLWGPASELLALSTPMGALLWHRESSEQAFRTLFARIPQPMWIYDRETLQFLAVNEAAIRHYGYSEAEFLQMTIGDIRSREESARLQAVLHGLPEGPAHIGVWEHRLKDGRLIQVDVSKHSLDFQGRPARMVLALDVTEQRRADLELKAREALLRASLRISQLGAWTLELPQRTMTWSEELFVMLELPADFRPTLEGLLERCDEDGRPQLLAAFEACLARGSDFDLELPVITGKGQHRWVRAMGQALPDEHGSIARIHGTLQDIDERKTAELRARSLEKQLARTLESISEAFLTLDSDWRFTYLNREAEQLLGRPRAQLLGASLWEVYPGTGGPFFEYEYRRARETGRPTELEEYDPVHDRWLNVRIIPYEEGLAIHLFDISERRHQREQLLASEQRFQSLARASQDALWDWNLVNDEMWWSEGLERLFGYRRDQLDTSRAFWLSALHPDDREAVVASLNEALTQGSDSWNCEYRFRRQDGSYADVIDRAYLVRDPHGKALRMTGDMTDLSERKAAQLRLEEQAALLDQASDSIIVRDLEHRILYWNRRAEAMYGFASAEALGRTVPELLHEDPVAFLQAQHLLLKDGQWTGELLVKHRDGSRLTVMARWTLLKDPQGNPQRVLDIKTDITERKQLQQQVLRTQRMESIGTLASGIAHDLNNVLAPILMSVEMLREELRSDESRRILDTIENTTRRGASLIRQVLGFARGMEGSPQRTNLAELAQDIRKIAADTFPRNIRFELRVSADLWSVHADPTQLHQVLMNLCVNARDAMPEGGQLTVSLKNLVVDEVFSEVYLDARPGPYVVIRVEDTGTGMSPEVREKIFEPFFTTKEVGKGTGLGLSTTFSIVKNHGGFINVYSEPGRGTKFKIYLPALAQAADEVVAHQPNVALHRGQGEVVLLVDDEASIREVTRAALQRFGYEVITAEDGTQGLAQFLLHRESIRVVISDMSMPGLDGPAMVRALRAVAPEVCVVGSSGLAANELIARARDAGVQHFVPKPYTAEVLLATLHRALHGSARQGSTSEVEQKTITVGIVVADDEPMVLQLSARALKSAGYEVWTASDGEQALQLLEQHGPQVRLLVTDQHMPGLSGSELIARASEQYPELRFILTSGERDADSRLHKELACRLASLAKPFSLSDLKAAVEKMLH